MYTDVFKFVNSQISNHPQYKFENIHMHFYFYRLFQIVYFNAWLWSLRTGTFSIYVMTLTL